ncbi:MAG: hypothetical protein M0Z53_00575 [Thermaerobacter sp.]|nr:hypothetical protein [Thermaerobacter sp.]
MPKIFFAGPRATGKTSIAREIEKSSPYAHLLHLASPLYDIAQRYFAMGEKDRPLLQALGTALRAVRPEVLLECAERDAVRIMGNDCTALIILDDVRLPSEVSWLLARGWRGWRVQVPESVRRERLLQLGEPTAQEVDNHLTEIYSAHLKLPVLDGTAPLPELVRLVQKWDAADPRTGPSSNAP